MVAVRLSAQCTNARVDEDSLPLCRLSLLGSPGRGGLSVPDSDMLISLSEVLETPVSTLLGETVIEAEVDTLKAISEKLEVINLQLAQIKRKRRKITYWSIISQKELEKLGEQRNSPVDCVGRGEIPKAAKQAFPWRAGSAPWGHVP